MTVSVPQVLELQDFVSRLQAVNEDLQRRLSDTDHAPREDHSLWPNSRHGNEVQLTLPDAKTDLTLVSRGNSFYTQCPLTSDYNCRPLTLTRVLVSSVCLCFLLIGLYICCAVYVFFSNKYAVWLQ